MALYEKFAASVWGLVAYKNMDIWIALDLY